MSTTFVDGYCDCPKHGRYTISRTVSSRPGSGPYSKDGWEHSEVVSECPGCIADGMTSMEAAENADCRAGAPWTFAVDQFHSADGTKTKSVKNLQRAGLCRRVQGDIIQYVLPVRT